MLRAPLVALHRALLRQRVLLAAGVLLLVSAATALAQDASVRPSLRVVDSSVTQVVETRDGSTLVGRVVAIEGDRVRFATAGGEVTLPIASVTRVREVPTAQLRAGAYWFPNPNATRLLFGPTGRMLASGDGYFSDYELFLPGFAVGVGDRFTIGGGASLIPGLGVDEQLYYFTPKVGMIATPRLNVAVGALVGGIPDWGDDDGDDDGSSFGVVYGVGTYGSPDASVTLGLGLGYADGAMADSPAIMLGAERRVSRRVALVTENYFFSGVSDRPLVSGAVRFMGEQIAVDLGLVNTIGGDAFFPGLPFVGFVVNF